MYCCPAKSAGGCGGAARRGDLVDQYISEAVLAKLEERTVTNRDVEPWPGQLSLVRQREKLASLRSRWEADEISDELFFSAVKPLEDRITELRADQAKHAGAAERVSQATATDISVLRTRWYKDEADGGLAISLKRAYLREALHAVILHPAGPGRKPFNPELLELICEWGQHQAAASPRWTEEKWQRVAALLGMNWRCPRDPPVGAEESSSAEDV